MSKAHRRFEHAEKEHGPQHGYLGCQIDETEEVSGDPDSQTVGVLEQSGNLWGFLS